jgi:hypothetical protein
MKIELKKKSRVLEGKTLKSFEACDSQRRLFTKLFGKSVRVTVKRAIAAKKKELDVSYLQTLMSFDCCVAYEQAAQKLYRTGGFKRRAGALKRKYKYGNATWYEYAEADRREEFYAAEAVMDQEYDNACTELLVLYWINDPKPRTERDPDDCVY